MNDSKNNVLPLEMIVDVRPVVDHSGAWVVSACVEQNGKINKRWIEPLIDGQIKCGSLGVFNGDKFDQQQDYYDAKYDIATVQSVYKHSFFGDESYDSWHYNIYSPKAGFYQFYPGDFYYDVARADNRVLLNENGKFLVNLTTMENIYDLCNGHNLRKYNLISIHDDKGKIVKYNNTAKYPYEYAGIPAVILGKGVCRTPGFFVNSQLLPDVSRIYIKDDGIWQPIPRPSDIVLLEATNKEDTFVLKKNLTLDSQNHEMNKKFGLAEHQNKIRRAFEETKQDVRE